jgi:hypothetical protein
MKGIHYDTEGDILTVKFVENNHAPSSGIELTEHIVLYYNPQTSEPLELILHSYQRLVTFTAKQSIALTGLEQFPFDMHAVVMRTLEHPSVSHFVTLQPDQTVRVNPVFIPSLLNAVV